jgi:phosphopantetheinyl transferase
VAALVAPVAVGLDAEWLARPRIEAARALFRASGELARLRSAEPREVLALWSAKEALLKLAGVGLADLGRCPLRSRESETYRLEHAGRLHDVRVRFEGAHVLAWTSASPLAVAWHVLQEVP